MSAHAGDRRVHVVGWSLGGIFALLAAAADTDLPIGSLTVLGSPFDVKRVPMVAPLRPLLHVTQGLTQGRGAITRAYQAMGGAPRPLVRWAFQLSSFQKLVTRPLAVATHLDDADFLAQLEAVDRFTDNMIAYPGRTFGQLYHRFLKANALVGGSFDLGDRTIRLTEITAPVMVFGGATDGIAPIAAVNAVVPLLTGSPEVRFEVVPGGHLGMLTGRAARTGTWPLMDEWIDQWSADVEAEPVAPRRAGGVRPRGTRSAPTRGAATGRRILGRSAAESPRLSPGDRAPRASDEPRSSTPAPATRPARSRRARHASARPTCAPRSSTDGWPSKCGVVKNGVDSSSTRPSLTSSDSTQKTITSS